MRNGVSLIAAMIIATGCSGGNQSTSASTGPAVGGTTSVVGSITTAGTTAAVGTVTTAGTATTAGAAPTAGTTSAVGTIAMTNTAGTTSVVGTITTSATPPAAGSSQATSGSKPATGSNQTTASIKPPASAPPPVSSPTPAKAALTISGKPVTALNENSAYVFLPSATDPKGGKLTFQIQNKPSWATFNPSNGELSGTPLSANVGTYQGIVISVTDGSATVPLPTFSINVTQYSTGSVTLSWLPPTTNTNGTLLTNLSGYRIYYGTSASSLTHSVAITNPGISSYAIGNLSPATWYFSLVSYNSANVESPYSPVVSKTIT